MILVGIDPGRKGGIAIFRGTQLVSAGPMPTNKEGMDYGKIVKILRFPDSDKIAYIERVHAMPSQGVVSMFSFGKGYGSLLGILHSLGYDVREVRPQDWKGFYSLKGKNKDASIRKCKELYPDIDLRPSRRCRTDSDGIAEAVLIGRYGLNM